jgi:hypothetical protein
MVLSELCGRKSAVLHKCIENIKCVAANGFKLYYNFLHSRLAFPWVSPMPEISSGMGVPDESRTKQQRHFSALYEWTALKWRRFRREICAYDDVISLLLFKF